MAAHTASSTLSVFKLFKAAAARRAGCRNTLRARSSVVSGPPSGVDFLPSMPPLTVIIPRFTSYEPVIVFPSISMLIFVRHVCQTNHSIICRIRPGHSNARRLIRHNGLRGGMSSFRFRILLMAPSVQAWIA